MCNAITLLYEEHTSSTLVFYPLQEVVHEMESAFERNFLLVLSKENSMNTDSFQNSYHHESQYENSSWVAFVLYIPGSMGEQKGTW